MLIIDLNCILFTVYQWPFTECLSMEPTRKDIYASLRRDVIFWGGSFRMLANVPTETVLVSNTVSFEASTGYG